MRRRGLGLCVGLAWAVALFVAPASADGDPGATGDRLRAREAYDRGAAAHERGDETTAARELALADELMPNPITLGAAIESATVADDAVLAMTLCERARRGVVEGTLAAAVQRAAARFARRVGRVRVACDRCAVAIDDADAAPNRFVVVTVGAHVITLRHDGQADRRPIDVAPGGTTDLVIADERGLREVTRVVPAPAAGPAAASPGSISRGWFFGALAATAVVGGVSIASGVDTSSKHAAFVSAGCAGPSHEDCSSLASAGQAAQLRTNVLATATGVLGAATVIAAVLTFRPRGADAGERASIRVAPLLEGTTGTGRLGAMAALRATLP